MRAKERAQFLSDKTMNASHLLLVLTVCLSSSESTPTMYGHVQSPLYPKPYPAHLSKQWDLKVPPGFQIHITFNYLDIDPALNCSRDYVKVLNDDRVLGRFCGRDVTDVNHPGEKPIVSPNNRLQLIFMTHQSTTENQQFLGFSAFYQAIDLDECSQNELVCSHYCHNFIGGYSCSCKPGYFLETNLRTCSLYKGCELPVLPDVMELKDKNQLTTYRQTLSVKCSSEFYQLVGSADFNCSAHGTWIDEQERTFHQNQPKCVPVCGLNKKIYSHGRIFGGEEASLGEIPWQLLYKGHGRGGATLINDRWALTAAYVVENKKDIVFYGGMVDSQDQNMVPMETEKIIIHPDYKNINGKNHDNDIALVKMKTRVALSDNLRPVCLPEKKTNGPAMEGIQGTVSGFGATNDVRMISRYLNYGHVEEYLESPCYETDVNVTDNMFCAGDVDGHVDSCKGDGGGPLFIPMLGTGSRAHPYRLKGIVSWGPPKCGNKNYKSYYTKVENYLDWIRDTMENN